MAATSITPVFKNCIGIVDADGNLIKACKQCMIDGALNVTAQPTGGPSQSNTTGIPADAIR